MSSESKQHWLDRNRPPRVQITYDVETLGSSVKVELPLVMGILADLLGDTTPVDKLKTRKFVQIDRDNFDDLMGQLRPTLKLKGLSRSVGEAGLTFTRLEDFHPLEIVKHSANLKSLLDKRQRLVDLVAKLSGNDTLNETFQQVFGDEESMIPQVKNEQLKRQRKLFEDARDAARALAQKALEASQKIPAQGFSGLGKAMDVVIQAARKVYRVEGAFNLLMALLPGEKNDKLKTAVGAFASDDETKKAITDEVAAYRTKLDGILKADAGETLNGLIDALRTRVDAAKDDKAPEVQAALDAIKNGPTKALTNLGPVKDIEARTKAYLADKSKPENKAPFEEAVKALRKLAGDLQKVDEAMKELDAATGVGKPEFDANNIELTNARQKLSDLLKDKKDKADAFATAAETYAKDPSKPEALLTAIQPALPEPLPMNLALSQATVLRECQRRIADAADARARRAMLMEPKAKEKATTARLEAYQSLDAARKLEGLALGITRALSAEPSPEHLGLLDTLHDLAEELHNSAEDTARQAVQRLQDQFPS